MFKSRKKRSIIWAMPDKEFISLVLSSETLGKMLTHFGLQNKGGNSRTLKTRIQELKIDISHAFYPPFFNKSQVHSSSTTDAYLNYTPIPRTFLISFTFSVLPSAFPKL